MTTLFELNWRATRGSLEYVALNALRELIPEELPVEDPKVRALALRLGVLGEAPKTLKKAGEVANLTRERIRQIQLDVEERLPLEDPPAVLRDAIAFVHGLLPGGVAQVGLRLREAGFADGCYSPEGLARLAALFGLSVPYVAIGGSGVSNLVVGTESPLVGGVEHVLATAEALDGRLHLVSARTVAEALRTTTLEALCEDDVDLILSSSDRWLALDGGWFYRIEFVGQVVDDILEGRDVTQVVRVELGHAPSFTSIQHTSDGLGEPIGASCCFR